MPAKASARFLGAWDDNSNFAQRENAYNFAYLTQFPHDPYRIFYTDGFFRNDHPKRSQFEKYRSCFAEQLTEKNNRSRIQIH